MGYCRKTGGPEGIFLHVWLRGKRVGRGEGEMFSKRCAHIGGRRDV